MNCCLNFVSDKITDLFVYSLAHPYKFYAGYVVFVIIFVWTAHYISG